MAIGPIVEAYGLAGIIIVLLGHLAYNIYENRRGRIAKLYDRLFVLAVLEYRRARRDDDVDAEYIRELLFNGDQVHFPSDFGDAIRDVNDATRPDTVDETSD